MNLLLWISLLAIFCVATAAMPGTHGSRHGGGKELSTAQWTKDRKGTFPGRIEEAIGRISASSDQPWLRGALNKFYEKVDYRLSWSTPAGWVPLTSRFLHAQRSMRALGIRRTYLSPRTWELVHGSEPVGDVRARVFADVALSAAFMIYSREFGIDCVTRKGRTVGRLEGRHDEPVRFLVDALGEGDAQYLFLDRFPDATAYSRLIEALVRYEALREKSKFETIPGSETLRAGDESRRVAQLRRRLRLTQDLSADSLAGVDSEVYDSQVEDAVRRFQARHGLEVDGVVGPRTLTALNVPLEERIRQIQLNLKRWGCLPNSLGESYILVNVPEYRLRAYHNGKEALRMPVVVGAAYDSRETPIFSDRVEHLVFRPYWNIPHSIAAQEILPKARRDPGYLARKSYEVVNGFGPNAKVHEPTRAALERVASGEFRLRQAPGPKNALGLVKFIFPNDFNVYLHDTPKDALFDRPRRAFSHGCIRVERPADLAHFILNATRAMDGQDYSREDITMLMNGAARHRIDLKDVLPVHIAYLTVWVEQDGTVRFARDIYGHDEEVASLHPLALNGTSEAA